MGFSEEENLDETRGMESLVAGPPTAAYLACFFLSFRRATGEERVVRRREGGRGGGRERKGTEE